MLPYNHKILEKYQESLYLCIDLDRVNEEQLKQFLVDMLLLELQIQNLRYPNMVQLAPDRDNRFVLQLLFSM